MIPDASGEDSGQVDAVLFRTGRVRVGTFRCPIRHPEFRTAGPIGGYTIGFPRTAVWIQHEADRPFLADPVVATVFNFAQPYTRQPLSPDGDCTDWFSVSRDVATSIARETALPGDGANLFPMSWSFVPSYLYFTQRQLLHDIRAGRAGGPEEIERRVIALVQAVLRNAASGGSLPAGGIRQPDPVARARAQLAGEPFRRVRLEDVAKQAGVSPYHLCRIFRRHTGMTVQTYRLELRARMLLARLEENPGSLSRLAHEMGYASHSHLTAELRRRLGVTPSAVRRRLARC